MNMLKGKKYIIEPNEGRQRVVEQWHHSERWNVRGGGRWYTHVTGKWINGEPVR